MTFFTVLITLAFERMAGQHRPQRRFQWFGGYCQWLTKFEFSQAALERPWGAALAILPLLIAVFWLQWLTDSLGFVFVFMFGLLALIISIGPRDLGDDSEAFIEARDSGDEDLSNKAAQSLCLSEVPDSEPRRSFAVARAVVMLANRRLIGPIFWFVALGPVGAVAYRLVYLLHERLQTIDCPANVKRGSDTMRHLVDWLPARVTAAGYAIAGNFDAVAHAWRTFDYQPEEGSLSEADALLAHAGLGALDTFPDDAEDLAGDAGIPPDVGLIPPVVEDAMALVWRSLAMWIAIIGGGSIIAAVA